MQGKKRHEPTRLWEHSIEIKWPVNSKCTNMMLFVHFMVYNLMQSVTRKPVHEILNPKARGRVPCLATSKFWPSQFHITRYTSFPMGVKEPERNYCRKMNYKFTWHCKTQLQQSHKCRIKGCLEQVLVRKTIVTCGMRDWVPLIQNTAWKCTDNFMS